MKITEFTPKDSINANHRKQNGYSGSYVGLDIANKKELFECRIYWTKERCYACLWVLGS